MKIYTQVRNSRKEIVSETSVDIEPIRVQAKRKLLPSSSGAPVVSSALIFFEPGAPVKRTDRIDLHGDGGRYEILQYYTVFDIDGNVHHLEIMI